MIFKQYTSNFVTYELTSAIHSVEDISEAVYSIGGHEGTLQIENDVISMKTKLVLTHFGSTFGTLGFDEKSFFRKLLGFTPY